MNEMDQFLNFASQQAGIPPEAAAAAAAAQGAQPPGAPQGVPPQAAPQRQAPPPGDTAEGKAQAAMAPATEGSRQAEPPIEYELPGKDGKPGRKFTASQIEGITSRYAALNHRHAQMAPVIQLAEQFMAQNPGATAQDAVDMIIQLTQAAQPNAQMGRQAQSQIAEQMGAPQKPTNAPLSMDALRQWEQENATSLPPGYAEMMQQMQQFGPMMAQQQSVLQRLLAQASGVADAARTSVAGAQSQTRDAVRMSIANNLDRAQQALQLPDDRANDFMMFAALRGYTMEDFVDPRLTHQVMTDFRNSILSGEMSRLKSVHEKRMAYTGLAGQTPTNGQSAGGGQDAEFDSFVNQIMSRRAG